MKIICTKEEFAKIVDDCAFNRLGNGGSCDGCFMRHNDLTAVDCAEQLVSICEIVRQPNDNPF